MAQDKKVTANRTYKSSVFTMVFQEKKELLELYNAVSGKHYEEPEEHASFYTRSAVCDLLQWRAGSAGTGDHAALQSLYGERRAAKIGTGSGYAQYSSGA